MDQKEVESRIEGLSPEQAKSVVCALIGHSKIVTACMGYIYCARCEDQIGDSLGGAGTTKENVIVGHACPTCEANFAKCDCRWSRKARRHSGTGPQFPRRHARSFPLGQEGGHGQG